MSTFFTSFGVNLPSLLFYLLFFGVILWILRRYLFKPVLGTIESRQQKINQSLDEAQEALASVKANRLKAEKLLDDASAEAREIINRAERLATDIHEDARREAKIEADLMVTKARVEIDREREAAIKDLRREAVDLALVAASRVIGENLSDDRSRKLAEEAVKQAELLG
jgi:F-type H+-transporting ATPase subunit b